MTRTIHIVGNAVKVGSRVRQLCAWCGATLVDEDEGSVAVHPPPAPGEELIPTWEPLALLAVEGTNPTSYAIVEHEDGQQIPAGFCGDEQPRLRLA